MTVLKKVFEDDWEGTSSNNREWSCVSLEEVLEAVQRLNGRNKTLVELIVDDANYLTIGGGNEGRYVCFITAGEQMHNLLTPIMPSNERAMIVAGGQPGEYDGKLCCDIEAVLKAVEYFSACGEPNPEQNWEDAGISKERQPGDTFDD